MPPKKRPPLITQLAGERRNKAHTLKLYILKTKEYCNVAVSQDGSEASMGSVVESVDRGLRSQGSKELFMLTVEKCPACNGRNIEVFQREYMALKKKVEDDLK